MDGRGVRERSKKEGKMVCVCRGGRVTIKRGIKH